MSSKSLGLVVADISLVMPGDEFVVVTGE